MNYSNLKISCEKAQEILSELFDIQAIATELPGSVDFNFRIKIENHEGYILKVSRPDEDRTNLDFQQSLLQYVEGNGQHLIAPKVIQDKDGSNISTFTDGDGNLRYVRLLSWISGRVWSSVNPQLEQLRFSLGEECGKLTQALQGFTHENASREEVWDVAQSLWTTEHRSLFSDEDSRTVCFFQELFKRDFKAYSELRKSVVHGDPNDNNVIVSSELINPKVKAAIDYGDAIHTQIINDLAIATAYAIMDHPDPLNAALSVISGYHSTFKIQEEELPHLYSAIAMRLVITVTKSAIYKVEEPDNEYLLISEKPAWEVLRKWQMVSPNFAHYSFRKACGFTPHPVEDRFTSWATANSIELSELFPSVQKEEVHRLDLSASSKWLVSNSEFADADFFQFKLDQLQKKHPTKLIAGGYLEPRSVYTTSNYDKIGNNGPESRTIHLGIDYWLPQLTPVHAILDGEIVTAVNDAGDKAYGGLIILKHQLDNFEFFTLYGHLSLASVANKKAGDTIKKGDCIGELGNSQENGQWLPHLHFQVLLSLLDYDNDFPGVAYYSEIDTWKSICPDPNILFNVDGLNRFESISNEELLDYRKHHLGKGLSLQYDVPIKMVRGAGQYLIDQYGRKYLDTVNNVAHVGHEHPAVVSAGQQQMGLLNTNSRYLHDNINALAKELLETLPAELSVLHFVNSGSEANELAIRMVKANTGELDIIASEVGYHGNSNKCIDISSYKFDGKGGNGSPEHTHIFPLPDAFRGMHRGDKTGPLYAEEVKKQIANIHTLGRGVGALILEPIISCGGQIELPKGFLAEAYNAVRAAGGLCISDEVQTGCGRVGSTFWGFQLHDVVPDIVTIGKPLGNGHPIAAVVCTEGVAAKFANGMEYFNTFGGNPVSCAIATEVLRTVKREHLQENALNVGTYLKDELNELAREFPIIGNVRGQGLFLGIELVDDQLKPLADQTNYLANRMKDHGILMSTDGPDHNVLKIKPPIVFTLENAKELLSYLRRIFAEDFMKSY
jgi:4-aminobutyrate aminotransferase-like enzyme/Ser/Thr protein kinase RdoA (MazF antagonist)